MLKSPLFGLDDDDLLALAPGRKGSLWQELVGARRRQRALRAPPPTTLKRWRARADLVPPFEFFSALLDADGMRARMLERLGAEAADAIDELLNLALAYDDERRAVPAGLPELAARGHPRSSSATWSRASTRCAS